MANEGGYSHARGDFIEALFNNPKALENLQKMYKLPDIYASINPSRTVRALEMIGVFSCDNPDGLIELPYWLDMKDANKKIKKVLKTKKGTNFRFKGCNELHTNADIKSIIASIQATGRYFQAEVELLKSILETRAAQCGGMPSTIKVIPLITDLVKEVDDTMTGLRRLASELSNESSSSSSSNRSFDHSHPHMPVVSAPRQTTAGSDPLRRRHPPAHPLPYHQREQPPPPPRPLPPPNDSPLLSSSPRVIEREARKLKKEREHHVPVILADDNPYQIFPARPNITTSQTFDNLSSGRPTRAETTPHLMDHVNFHTPQPPSRHTPQYNNTPHQQFTQAPSIDYDDTVSSGNIPPVQYADIRPALPPRPAVGMQQQQPIMDHTTNYITRPMLPLRAGGGGGGGGGGGVGGSHPVAIDTSQQQMHLQEQQIRQQNPFQPRPFGIQEQNHFEHHGQLAQQQTSNITTRPPPPIPLPFSTAATVNTNAPPSFLISSPTNKSSTMSSNSSYVEMKPAPSVLIKESTSTTSIQSVDRYQHLRHSRMEPRDSYMNMADTGLESPTLRRDPSYMNVNPVIDSLRDDNEGDLIQEEYDTFGMSATNPFYSNK